MRLLDTALLKLREFPPDCIPHYAILSHTWTDEEVSFADFFQISEGGDTPESRKKTKLGGYAKIETFCHKAKTDGYSYAWVDTCCIDKSSSAELSEAINSMYRWYSASECCYIHLDGYSFTNDSIQDLGKCRWFTRAWTLQELIAPRNVQFYDQRWRFLGDKDSLGSLLSEITGIPATVLNNTESCFSKSVAQRMSWASKREATREEDIAYSLMGIFDVNMPMLYGEGQKSFRRLQEEIRKASTDQTLFAWAPLPGDPPETGLLAIHPRNFRDSARFEDVSQLMKASDLSQEGFSGRGINTNVFLPAPGHHTQPGSKFGLVRAMLRCAHGNDPDSFACIMLRHLRQDGVEFVRSHSHPESFALSTLQGVETNIFVPHSTTIFEAKPMLQRYVEVVESSPHTYQSHVSVLFRASALGPFPIGNRGVRIPNNPSASDTEFRHIDGKTYVESDPTRFRYHMPWQPGQEILKICIDLEDPSYFVCAHLRLDENGDVEYAVEHGHTRAKTRTVKATLQRPWQVDGILRGKTYPSETVTCSIAEWRAYRDYYTILFASFMSPIDKARVVDYDLRRSLGESGVPH